MEPESEGDHRDHGADEVVYQNLVHGLRDILGQSGLEMVLSLHPLERIWTRPEAFHAAMKEIFMEEGARIIEREVAKRVLDGLRGDLHGQGRDWRQGGDSGAEATRRAAARSEALRRFVAMAGVEGEHHARSGWVIPSIEVTSMRFASAFRKGG